MSEQNQDDRLTALRLLTEWTGQVTEAQVKTLNIWPSVMIDGVKSHEVRIDVNEKKVVFKLKFKANKSLKDLNAVSRLETGVWALLGDSWKTIVKGDGRILYAGSPRRVVNGAGINLGQGREGFDPKRAGSVPKVPAKR